jgi:hypothetical protein
MPASTSITNLLLIRREYRILNRVEDSTRISLATVPRYAQRDGRRGCFISTKDMYNNDGGQVGSTDL